MTVVHLRNLRDGICGEPREMRVEDGRIAAYGERVSAEGAFSEDAGSQRILAGFVDAHCHILPTGLDLRKLNLSGAGSAEEVLDLVAAQAREQPHGWLLAVQYDQNRFRDGEHLTRDRLDAISAERPILLRHANGHAGVANSGALALAGVGDGTPDPPGGAFGRSAEGRLNGVLLEHALDFVFGAIPGPPVDLMADAIVQAGERMRALGIVCAADMMTGHFNLADELAAYRLASERGCPIATRLYVEWDCVFGERAMTKDEFDARTRQLAKGAGMGSRVAGVKLFADGAIASGTAAIYGAYEGRSPTGWSRDGRPVSGQLIYSPAQLTERVRTASDAGWQVAVHAIGDYAADLVMDAFEATGEPSRHRIEHAMLLSDAQIERLAKLGCAVCFQPEFLMRFGHAYRRQLGDGRAACLKRSRSVLDAGIPLAFSSDRPIVAGDPRDGIHAATSREGFEATERCAWEEAVRAYTESAAAIDGDAGEFGALVPGARAEYQLLPPPVTPTA